MNPDPVPTIPPQPGGDIPISRQSSAWDLKNAPRNYISLVLTQGASAAFSFASVWLITQYLGSEGYGGIVAVIAASQLAQVFVNWTAIAVVRFSVDEFIETATIVRTFWVRLAALTLNLLIVIGASVFWFSPLAAWLKLSPETYWLVIAHFTLTALWIHVQMSLQGAKMLRLQGVLMMIERLLITAGIVGLLYAANLTATTTILCYIAAPAAMIVAGVIALGRLVLVRFDIDRSFIHTFVSYSFPLLPMAVVSYFSSVYLQAVVISTYLSTSALGGYSVATQIHGIILQLPVLANSLLLPLFVSFHKEAGSHRIETYFKHLLPTGVFFWGVFATVAALVGSALIPAVFKLDASELSGPVWILLAGSTLNIPVLIGYGTLSNSSSATYISFHAAVAAGVLNLVLSFVLIPEFGLEGAAWAITLSYLFSSATFAAVSRARLGTPASWWLLAMTPVLVGSVLYSIFKAPLLSSVGALSTGVVVYVVRRTSIGEAWTLFARIRNRAMAGEKG